MCPRFALRHLMPHHQLVSNRKNRYQLPNHPQILRLMLRENIANFDSVFQGEKTGHFPINSKCHKKDAGNTEEMQNVSRVMIHREG